MFKDVRYGEHLVSVEEPGRAPWGTTRWSTRRAPNVVVPGRAALTLDDRIAAAHANRMGTKFALVGGAASLGEGPPESSCASSTSPGSATTPRWCR